jgi:hypothetical protein
VGRTVPNLPGSLVRHLSRRLSVSPTVAIRLALLYGDIEWLAAGQSQLRYSASDYARRMGFHRNTVHADLQQLRSLGAIAISADRANTVTLQLLGLHTAIGNISDLADADSNPCPPQQQDPCLSQQQPLAATDSNPLLLRAATLEKTSKTQEKEDRKKKRGKLARPSPEPDQTAEQPGSLQSPGLGRSRASKARGSGAEPQEPPGPPEPQAAALLDRLLAAFRDAAPPEWPAPERLTASRERRSRLRQALEHAGSAEALEARLRAALGAVPVWFRHTYPVRPDGSRRPAYQFFDLLLRASAAERDCGVEAWHLFAWSEGELGHGATPATPGAGSPSPDHQAIGGGSSTGTERQDLEIARRWFSWGAGQWSIRDIRAFKVGAAEQRRLTGLLETAGLGIPGTGALQFADPEPDDTSGEDNSALLQPEPVGSGVGER